MPPITPAKATVCSDVSSPRGSGRARVRAISASMPAEMPADLHWFKYEAYFTWITGFLLLSALSPSWTVAN